MGGAKDIPEVILTCADGPMKAEDTLLSDGESMKLGTWHLLAIVLVNLVNWGRDNSEASMDLLKLVAPQRFDFQGHLFPTGFYTLKDGKCDFWTVIILQFDQKWKVQS